MMRVLYPSGPSPALQTGKNAGLPDIPSLRHQLTTHFPVLPKFEESSNPELNSLLDSLRSQYLIPAYLKKHERRMLFAPQHKNYLTENTVTTRIGNEEIPLEWLGDTERPDFAHSIKRATKLIMDGDDTEWANLPPLLQGTHEGLGRSPHYSWTERVVRKAVQVGQMEVVMRLLRSANETGVSLKLEGVRRYVLVGLRQQAQRDDWGEDGLKAALKNAQHVAAMLESPEHGSGKLLKSNDPRTQPETIGVFLELAAAYAYRCQDGKDASGMVKTYAERLLHSLQGHEIKVGVGIKPIGLAVRGYGLTRLQIEVKDRAPQWPMLSAISIWHGLRLALKVVGNELNDAELAQRVVADFGSVLSTCASNLEAESPKPGTHRHQALEAWQSCMRD